MAEGTSNISQLPSGSLVLDQDFAYTELVKSKIDEDTYHIIGTNYSNFTFPLIRYDSNDLLTAKKNDLGELQIISIDGRNEDYVTLPNGIKVGRLDHIFKEFTFVKEAQIFQISKRKIIFKIVKNVHYDNKKHESLIFKKAKSYLGSDLKYEINYLHKIERSSSGKLKFVVSKI